MIRAPLAILFILTGLNLLNYLDRNIVAAVLPNVLRDLSLTKTEGGFLYTAFLLGYSLTGPFFAFFADRGKRPALLALGVAIWSIATALSGIVESKWGLFLCRGAVGIGEASYLTIAPTLIDEIAPKTRKGLWLSTFFAAGPIGAALGYVVGGNLAVHYGWRNAFLLVGGPGIFLAFLCLLIFEPRTAKAPPFIPSQIVRGFLTDARELLGRAPYVWTVGAFCLHTFALYGFGFWAPTFLADEFKMNLAKANTQLGVVTVLGGLVGTMIGGVILDRSIRREEAIDGENALTAPREARIPLMLRIAGISTLAATLPVAIAFVVPSGNLFFPLAFIAEVALFAATTPINSAVLQSVPAERRASATAFMIFSIHVFGDLWSPPLIGAIAGTGSLRTAMMLVPLTFLIAGLGWCVGSRKLLASRA